MKSSKKWFVIGFVLLVILGVTAYFVMRQRKIVSYDPAKFFFAPIKGEAVLYANLPDYERLVSVMSREGLLESLAKDGKVDREFIKDSAKYISRVAYVVYFLSNGEKEQFLFVTPKLSMDIKNIKKILLILDPTVKVMKLQHSIHDRDVYKFELKGRKTLWSFYAEGSLIVSDSKNAIQWLLDVKAKNREPLSDYLPHRVKGKWYGYVDVNEITLRDLIRKRKFKGELPKCGVEIAVNRKESGMIVLDAFVRSKNSKKKSIVDTSQSMLFVTKVPMLKDIVAMFGANVIGKRFVDEVEKKFSLIPKLKGEDPFKLIGATKERISRLFNGGVLMVVGGKMDIMGNEYPAFFLYLMPKDGNVLLSSAEWLSGLLSSHHITMEKKSKKGWKRLFVGNGVVPVFVGVRDNYMVFGVGKLDLLSSDALTPRQIKNISKEAKGALLFLDVERIKRLVERFAANTRFKLGVEKFLRKIPRISYVVVFLKDYNLIELRAIP